ncbi:phosphatases II [Auriscalpium vulgare]|uniref:Phosphatases II n=1 Tax=Auriscalpium vulgare TaxID=40419 RepID=A0ACB8S523_9AGAM|nr:phosphatases II [Auriscalpium vulgare]
MHLASQFHASDYARAKFGARGAWCHVAVNPPGGMRTEVEPPTDSSCTGSALTYIPLSIHFPAHFKELQARQARFADEDAWWLSEKGSTSAGATDALLMGTVPATSLMQSITVSEPSISLQDELSSAIETPLGGSMRPPGESQLLKTSETHPLSISSMIPADLLSTISLHLSLSSQPSAAMFDIHPAFSLERLTCYPPTPVNMPPPPPPTEPLPRLSMPISGFQPSTAQLQLWNRSSMKSALQSALASDISVSPPSPPTASLAFGDSTIFGEILACANGNASADDGGIHDPEVLGIKRSFSAPTSTLKTFMADSLAQGRHVPYPKTTFPYPRRHCDVAASQAMPRRPRLVQFASQIPPQPTRLIINTPSLQPSTSPTLGNLLLSSCPGKKVRLTGPVRGRGAVCRDLKQDLRRIKALGVGCIVCCLDDEELTFLGASWPEYSKAAHDLQIDILRIPVPEGLAPASTAIFDAHLTRLISVYTLAGTPVLVHCRGGVGRAGLVACCWMLKLGLCGWPVSQEELAFEGQVRKDTLQLVERVIGVVRRRRSLKAIETYEQVKFLVSYVELLRERAVASK